MVTNCEPSTAVWAVAFLAVVITGAAAAVNSYRETVHHLRTRDVLAVVVRILAFAGLSLGVISFVSLLAGVS